jgi:1-deoxy-D-xylulose-5-phosphate synthase
MLYTGITLDQPSAVRYPRGTGPGVRIERKMTALPVGTAEVRREGGGPLLLAVGAMVPVAESIAKELDATVVNLRFVKPLDEELIVRLARQHDTVVTLEDNATAGGAGSAVNECLNAHGVAMAVLNLGIPDRYIPHGSRDECLALAGLDEVSVLAAIRDWLGEPTRLRAGGP